jgi:serine/threonine-protein kinase HipA
VTVASVWLNDVRVGSIERFTDSFETHVFTFDPGYLRHPTRPVLGQLFEDRLPNPIETHGLLPWFDHVLPQGALRRAIEREATLEDDDGLGLLVWLGEDLPGAVRVLQEPSPASYRRAPRVLSAAGASAALRVSLSGMQWKVSVSRSPSGLTLPVRGQEGEWIAKFQGRDLPRLVQIEHATMRWARLSGLDVPDVEIVEAAAIERLPANVPLGDGKALLVRRFDRSDHGRIHMEDFAQVLDRPDQFGGAHEEIGTFISDECPTDREEFVRRLAFTVGSGNHDGHLKNWSLTYPSGRRARLAPAYDQIATVVFPQFPPTLALRLSNRRDARFDSLRLTDLELMATALGLPLDELKNSFRSSLERVIRSFEGVASDLSDSERRAVELHHTRLRLMG